MEGIPEWCHDHKYRLYWQHHQKVTDWFKAHKASQSHNQDDAEGPSCQNRQFVMWCKSMTEYHTSMARWMMQLGSYYSNWSQTWLQHQQNHVGSSIGRAKPGRGRGKPSRLPHSWAQQHHAKRKSVRSPEESGKKHKQRKGSSDWQHLECETFQMEVTEEMMDFFAQSAKHKKERDAKKRADFEVVEEHVNLGEVSAGKNKATVLPPSERPGAKRAVEMKELYGQGAPMIHGMETAMQLNFDRNCDRQQPKLWPQLPLNIVFSQK